MTSSKTYPVKASIQEKSFLKGMAQYQAMYDQSINEPNTFWLDVAKNISWFHFPEKATRGDFWNVDHAWFMG